jgi:hypothetical protein
MAKFYIVNTTDGTVTKTDDVALALSYEYNDEIVVIDSDNETVLFQGEVSKITEEEHADDEPEAEEEQD